MTKTNSTTEKAGPTEGESLSRRVADELHERIDQAASKVEEIERTLNARGAQAHDKAIELGEEAQIKAHKLNQGFAQVVRDNPWAVMGGAIALGFVIGALSTRR